MGRLRRLLEELPEPIGIFCDNERLSDRVLHTAEQSGRPIPDSVSVLAVGSADRSRTPEKNPISVICLDHRLQGRRAAEALVECLTTRPTHSRPQSCILAPGAIAHGATTRAPATSVLYVRRGWRIIWKTSTITPPKLATSLSIPERTLQFYFRNAHQMTVKQVIAWVGVYRTAEYMAGHRHKLEAIAGVGGFESRQQLRRWSHRFMGITPQELHRICIEKATEVIPYVRRLKNPDSAEFRAVRLHEPPPWIAG